MKFSKLIVALTFALLVFAVLPKAAAAPEQIECGADDLDGGHCGGCTYGILFDGTCEDDSDGGGWCQASNVNLLLTSYNDVEFDDNGNLEAWAITSNSDGNAGEGSVIATVTITLPDGTTLPSTTQNSLTAASVSASTSAFFIGVQDLGLGGASYVNQINWNCGIISVALPKITVGYRITYEAFTGFTLPGPGAGQFCYYEQACLFSTPTCAQTLANAQPLTQPCAPYLKVLSPYFTWNGNGTCGRVAISNP